MWAPTIYDCFQDVTETYNRGLIYRIGLFNALVSIANANCKTDDSVVIGILKDTYYKITNANYDRDEAIGIFQDGYEAIANHIISMWQVNK